MRKAIRVVGVTLGLVAAGALVGSTAALLAALTFAFMFFGLPTEPPDAFLVGIVAGVGAVLGAVVGPMVGWLACVALPSVSSPSSHWLARPPEPDLG